MVITNAPKSNLVRKLVTQSLPSEVLFARDYMAQAGIEDPLAKVERAKEHILNLNSEVLTFPSRKPLQGCP